MVRVEQRAWRLVKRASRLGFLGKVLDHGYAWLRTTLAPSLHAVETHVSTQREREILADGYYLFGDICDVYLHAPKAALKAYRRAIKFDLSSGLLALSSNNPDVGEAREELDVDYAGEKLSIAFNARYLIDAVSALGSKEVRLSFQDELSPVKLMPADDSDTLAVVMPMRI